MEAGGSFCSIAQVGAGDIDCAAESVCAWVSWFLDETYGGKGGGAVVGVLEHDEGTFTSIHACLVLRYCQAIGSPDLGDLKLFPILLDTLGLILDGKLTFPFI